MNPLHPRVVHLISEFSSHEAMGRTVTETAQRVDGDHYLITTAAHDDPGCFEEIVEVEGDIASFPIRERAQIRAIISRLRPDVIHIHAGVLGPFFTAASGLGKVAGIPVVMTMYAWPTLPRPGAWRNASIAEMRQSNVLSARVALTSLVPPATVRATLRRLGVKAVLTPDPRVRQRLGNDSRVPVVALKSGAPTTSQRAQWNGSTPTILFAGRAETVRGIDTLVRAFPLVRRRVPGARLRLLLIPRPEMATILESVANSEHSEHLEVVTEPVPDLLSEMASAQVGVWPFKFDYTTSPPAMAVAEALSVGLPVVSTDVVCVKAVLQGGVNGVTTAVGDPGELADAIVDVLTDRNLWNTYAAAGPASVADFSWQKAAQATAQVYAEVATQSPV